MIIHGVQFPPPLVEAFHNQEIVIFAGAGVSVGKPANLYLFDKLAELIALGTGQAYDPKTEPPDRFLGRLNDDDVRVHTLAAEILQENNPQPRDLHRNLLRMFRRSQDVRIVTTNFDVLFERAAKDVFTQLPKLYQGPALPIGNKFRGIVHLHGSVDVPDDLVLTHQDFGRAYLTEADGWARRFLVDLFNERTVLFVGYSHRDTMMTYFTPSLPPLDVQSRFALIAENDNPDYWKRMGIEPIPFPQQDPNDFSSLDLVVAELANLMRQRIRDWKTNINAIAKEGPPEDEQKAGIIDQAFTSPERARFFAEAADSPDWIEWLDKRGHLNKLFNDGALTDPDLILCRFLAQSIVTEHPEPLFAVIENHGGRVNSYLWYQLARQLGRAGESDLHPPTVSRWLHFLMSCVPARVEDSALSGLAETCAELGLLQNLLQLFDAMIKFRNNFRPGFERDTRGIREQHVRRLRERCIEPHLGELALPLLQRITIKLEERRSAVWAWSDGNDASDADSGWRSAIDPGTAEKMPRDADHLIDFARLCLDWLSVEMPETVGNWTARQIKSGAPLLRRLAVYATSLRQDIDANEKLSWLLERGDINDPSSRHEITKLVATSYPSASDEQRTALIQAVLDYEVSPSAGFDDDARSAFNHHIWFDLLHAADPECGLAQQALQTVQEQHPEFGPFEDVETAGSQPYLGFLHSRWTEEELLSRNGADWLQDLLCYQPTLVERRYGGYHRSPTLTMVSQASATNAQWGFDLAQALAEANLWDSDLWPSILSAWTQAEFGVDALNVLLDHLEDTELQERHAFPITSVLLRLAQSESALDAELLTRANGIAEELRKYVPDAEPIEGEILLDGVQQYENWLQRGDRHLSGNLAWYWVYSIVCWTRLNPQSPVSINDEYRKALNAIMNDHPPEGKFGRAVLASNLHLFLEVDIEWAEENLLPMFAIEHEDFRPAWEGFLDTGRLTPAVAERLEMPLMGSLPRILSEFDDQLAVTFIQWYVECLSASTSDSVDDRIIEFFRHADIPARVSFADEIRHRLSELDETAQTQWWDAWVKDYWKNRIRGKPKSLDDAEIERMLEWPLHLVAIFPDAVDLAVTMRPAPFRRTWMFTEITEGPLVDRYPQSLSRLLVDLDRRGTEPLFWLGSKDTVTKLLKSELHPELEMSLKDLEVKYQLEE